MWLVGGWALALAVPQKRPRAQAGARLGRCVCASSAGCRCQAPQMRYDASAPVVLGASWQDHGWLLRYCCLSPRIRCMYLCVCTHVLFLVFVCFALLTRSISARAAACWQIVRDCSFPWPHGKRWACGVRCCRSRCFLFLDLGRPSLSFRSRHLAPVAYESFLGHARARDGLLCGGM